MNKEEADYLYLDRKKGRIEYELRNALESGSEADIREVIECIEEFKALMFGPEEPVTAASVLQDLCDLSQATEIKDSETGNPISLIEYQDMIFQKVELLADVLGVELKG